MRARSAGTGTEPALRILRAKGHSTKLTRALAQIIRVHREETDFWDLCRVPIGECHGRSTLQPSAESEAGLAQIKALGVRIAIDDFGTGYSSLAHLQRFPVDALKIDRSFISGLEHNREGETLIHTLVQLGKALSIETVAEGIEQQHELALLQDVNCDNGQGFLFARPLDAAATQAFLENWAEHTEPPSPTLAGSPGWT